MRNHIYYLSILSLALLMVFGYQNVDADNSNSKNTHSSILEKYGSYILKESNPWKSWSNELLWESIDKNRSDTLHSVKSNPNINEKSNTYASFSASVNKNVPAFNFKLVGLLDKYDSFENFIPSYIEIRNSSDGRFIQKITVVNKVDKEHRKYIGYGHGDLWLADMVQLVDLNFDGYLDLRILENVGATGCNSYVSCLYDPKLKKFVFNKKLSRMLVLRLDPKTKQIITYDRSGYCEEYMRYYKVRNNQFVVTKVEWTDTKNVNAPCYKYTGVPLREGLVTGDEVPPYVDKYPGKKSGLHKKLKNLKKEEFDGSLDGRRRGSMGVPSNKIDLEHDVGQSK